MSQREPEGASPTGAGSDQPAPGGRRPPPPFRRVEVVRTERLTPRMMEVTLAGPDLQGLALEQPAASIRLLLSTDAQGDLVIPRWAGNEFLLPNGRRPLIRTLTPRRLDPRTLELDVNIVIHPGGAASRWASAAGPGTPAAVSGPARGYTVDQGAPTFFLAGDETAIPAISQLLERLPPDRPVRAEIEIAVPAARGVLPERPGATVSWLHRTDGAPPGEALVAAVTRADLPPETRIWIAGEAAAVQRVRRHLFEERGLPRGHAAVRGYWKHGRAAGADDPG
jgi:NADPH-dependent ferric siderophore reductase